MNKIETEFTKMFGIDYPIIGAPMFLVSNVDMVTAISNAGAIGSFPALNFRPIEKYREALEQIRQKTKMPFGVNIIVNKSNQRQDQDLKFALESGAKLIVTSLGSPKKVIEEAHRNAAKVFCDVTNLEHALKVQDQGADGVIAVSSGAGGHAGPISPLVLVPWLKEKLSIPIVAAGGVANGASMAAALALGASAVHVGTRFIASQEAGVEQAYKDAVVNSSPEDIVMTTRISGTPAAVINTDYVKKMNLELPLAVKILKEHPLTKKYMVPIIHYLGMKSLEQAASTPTFKTLWSAGQSVGLIHDIKSCREIVDDMVKEYFEALSKLPGFIQGAKN
jgi:nitronate monooxygenase